MKKRAIILAGGKGTRLKPYTVVLPKPLMPIGEYPILEVVIRQLSSIGFKHITLAVNHQAELIKAFFGNGSKWDIKIDYSLEEQPLGTMGPLKLVENLPENFLVMNGDILTNLDFELFYNNHLKSKSYFTISSTEREEYIDFGVLEVDTHLNLIKLKEKPKENYLVSMGIYMINRKIIDLIPANINFGFDNLMYLLINKNIKVNVYKSSDYWLDIGRPDDYKKAIEVFETKQGIFLNE